MVNMAIIGIQLGAVIALVVVAVTAVYCLARRRK